jgi:hypothetical protein
MALLALEAVDLTCVEAAIGNARVDPVLLLGLALVDAGFGRRRNRNGRQAGGDGGEDELGTHNMSPFGSKDAAGRMAASSQGQTDQAQKPFAAGAQFLRVFGKSLKRNAKKRRSRFQLRQVLCWSYKDSVPESRGGGIHLASV